MPIVIMNHFASRIDRRRLLVQLIREEAPVNTIDNNSLDLDRKNLHSNDLACIFQTKPNNFVAIVIWD